jgi:2'-5' RNA ligase
MNKYLCAITLPDAITAELAEVQQNYKSSSWNIAIQPHITLTPPAMAVVSLDQAEKILSEAAKAIKPFDIEVEGVDMFQNSSNTVFASVKPSEELLRLYTELRKWAPSIAANIKMENNFHPHVTLSNKLNPVLAAQIKAQLAEQRIHFTFPCQSFSLFSKTNLDKQWVEQKRLYF